MTDNWHPCPRALIDDALTKRWSKKHPAPDIVGFMAAFARINTASPWTARSLAEWAGWSRWKASQILSSAKSWESEWNNSGHSIQKATGHHSGTIPDTYGTDPATFRTDSSKIQPSRAGNYNTRHDNTSLTTNNRPISPLIEPVIDSPEGISSATAVPVDETGLAAPESKAAASAQPEQPKKAPRIAYAAFWDAMEGLRLAKVPNARRIKMGRRHSTIRARISEHGEKELIHAWRWLWESSHPRALFLRENNHATYETFFRASKCSTYVQFAAEWDPATERKNDPEFDIFNLGDDAFDEQGNIIAFQQPGNS